MKEKKTMNAKPSTLVREDFINDLATLINTSPLPMFAIEPILRQYADAVAVASKQQLETDRQNYFMHQSQQQEKAENNAQENNAEENPAVA